MSGERDGMPAMSTRSGNYPMTLEQEGLWLDDLVWDGPSRNLEAWACRLAGRLDVDALDWAIGQVLSRHEVLRSRLTEWDGEPVQIVTAGESARLRRLSCAPAAVEAEVRRVAAEPLDLDQGPFRPWLIGVSSDEFVLVLQLHHAVIDGWSLNVLLRELQHFYAARVLARPPRLEPLRIQAGDFAVGQRATGMDPVDIAYWRERVRGAPRSCTIPPDRPGSAVLTHRGGRNLYRIDAELGQAVRSVGRTLRTTPFTVFAGAMAALLGQYGDAPEVIFGTPVSLRGTAALDDMIGCLTNMYPLRMTVSPDVTFRMLVNAAKAEVLGAMAHRAVPYSAIVQMSRLDTAADAPPPCDAALIFDDMRWDPFGLPGVSADALRLPPGHAKFAVLLRLATAEDGGYEGWWEYDAEVFEPATVARVATQFTELLIRSVAAPDEQLGHITGSPPRTSH